MTPPDYPSDHRGFTLLELLITIAVVGILLVLLSLSVQRVQERGNMAKCITTLRQIVVAIHRYAQDHEGRIPLYGISKNDPMVTFWPGTLAPYFFNEEATSTRMVGYGKWGCPAAKEPYGYSYGVNYTGNVQPPIFTYPRDWMTLGPRIVNLAGGTMLIMDSHQMAVYNPKGWPLNNGDSNVGIPIKYNNAAFDRHNMTINAGFVDGSVRNVSLADWKANQDKMWGY